MSVKLSREALVQTFHTCGRPREEWLVGGEFERHLLRRDGSPLPYAGPGGVAELLERLGERGWGVVREAGRPIAVMRGRTSVTLEPGAQFELSGAPAQDLADLAREAEEFTALVEEVAGPEVAQVAIGYTPFARLDDIDWVPKGRYAIMRDYLGRQGDLAHAMMKGTCAVQANYDYADEADCKRKVELASGLCPVSTALFANSPLVQGRPSGFASWRGHVWTRTDPDRQGIPPALRDYSHEAWVDYLLDAPMMFWRGGEGTWLPAHGLSFRAWMEGSAGFEREPTWQDWALHLTSVFPHVRIKGQVEVRCADCVSLPLAVGFCALWEGLFYCDRALERAIEVAHRFRAYGSHEERYEVACRGGLRGLVGGRSLAEWAGEIVDIAINGLSVCSPEDQRWLRPLQALTRSGNSPADALLEAWERDPSPASVIRAASYRGR